MGFSFDQRKDMARQVRAIASDQIDAAIQVAQADGDFHKTIHRLRRRCKKVRGLLRLVRPNFPKFDIENAAIRDAAKTLSVARDAAVLIETFDQLLDETPELDLPRDRLRSLRAALELSAAAIAAGQDRQLLFSQFALAMSTIRNRLDDWKLKGDGFDLIEPGFAATYIKMRKSMRAAKREKTALAFHDWRRDAKYHGFQVSLLRSSAPAVLGGRKASLSQLGQLLGDHHNLAVLAGKLAIIAGPVDPALVRAIAEKQAGLAKKALDLGPQLTVESPAALVSRMEKLWKRLPKES